ncbi:hypothetical protein WG66_000196 [Moniliophthora roreri]|uniref:Uncharacterized protein n=1 Tax=Moniliophthora roreri TaxID=221103 RepID=A0A0W0EYE8_MONRR|nr:hypothetical protein WG66_000196 [Moniliophthora roreri]
MYFADNREQRHFRDLQERYAHLERRIRSISTAIWLTHSQGLAFEPIRLQDSNLRKRLQAYQDLSILFTTDSSRCGPVVVTGGPTHGSSPSVTLVAGSTRTSTPRDSTTQGPSLMVDPRILMERIIPSSRSLTQLVESGSAAVTPMTHFSDVLQALHLSSTSTTREDMELIHQFFLARCWSEFKARIDAAQYLLDFPPSTTIVSLLKAWHPVLRGADSQYGTWVDVGDPFLLNALRGTGIQLYSSGHDGVRRCMFDQDTALIWYRLLCSVLDGLFTITSAYHVDQDPTLLANVAYHIQVLAPLLDSVPVQHLFRTLSFRNHIHPFRKRISYASLINNSSIDHWQMNILSDEQKISDSFRENEGEHITRYLHSILSWYKASTSLFHDSTCLSRQPPIFQVLFISVSVDSPMTMHSPAEVAWRELEKALAAKFDYTLHEVAAFQTNVYSLLRGTPIRTSHGRSSDVITEVFTSIHVHTEAITMAVLKGSAPGSCTPGPVLITQDQLSAEHLVVPFDRLLGFPSPHPLLPKCCYCCSLLYDVLYNPNRALSRVSEDPATDYNVLDVASFVHSGFLVPWTPPPIGYGLSLRALKIVERELCRLLVASLSTQLGIQV